MIADALYIRTLNVQGYSPVCVLNSCSVPTERDTSEYISAERTQDTLANRKVTPAHCTVNYTVKGGADQIFSPVANYLNEVICTLGHPKGDSLLFMFNV